MKELIELHHGSISVISEENKETTFIIKLPLGSTHLKPGEIVHSAASEEADYSEPASIPIEEFVEGTTLTSAIKKSARGENGEAMESDKSSEETLVLIVEDNIDLRHSLRRHLESDYKIMEAENGAIGLQKAEELIPDLIISDMMMPEMDGNQLCKGIKSNDKTNHIPVILLTGEAAELEMDADEYLRNPFNPEELRICVKNLIHSHQQMREKFAVEMFLKAKQVTVPSSQRVFLERLNEVIERHIDDEYFSAEKLGGEMGMSRAQIHRKLRAITNQSASAFIRTFRLQRAAELLLQDAGNIAEIANQVGFNDQAYFMRSFQDTFGCSPTEYKRKQGE